MIQVRKRNGAVVPFDKTRIENAVSKAIIEVYGQDSVLPVGTSITNSVEKVAQEQIAPMDVETIQDTVENLLMDKGLRDVARAYIRYRYRHEVARDSGDDFIKALSEKINARDIENSNANMDEASFGGRVGAASDLQMKKYALDYCVSRMARSNHENNEIYIHDLNALPLGEHNCLSIPFDKLLAEGFTTRQTDVRPAGSVNTAFQLVAVIFQLQSLMQFG